ncbi:MAG TPA: glycosyltransferase family 4 protein [Acidimicrobiales bacterium]
MTAVHQFVPALLPRDATGDHTLALREALRAQGWQSDIYVEAAHDELQSEATYFEEYTRRSRPGDILVYQASTGSPVAEYLLGRPETLVLDYHNITPASFYAPWEPHTAEKVTEARRQVAALAPRAALGVAHSQFSAAELASFGCPSTVVVPILVSVGQWSQTPDPETAAAFASRADGGTVVLFVGRLSPNKAQHELVQALWLYRRWYDPRARLLLVGPAISGGYADAVVDLAAELGLAGAVVHGEHLTSAELAAWYGAAHVFVCLSDHEGFCIPLLEAMQFDLPIVAFAAGAVPETVGPAGVLLEVKRPSVVAAAIDRVRSDAGLAGSLVALGRRRLSDFEADRTRNRFVEVLQALDGQELCAR